MSTKMAECFGVDFVKKFVSYNTYSSDSSFWILNGLVSSCFDKCWYLWWRKWDGRGHSLKPRIAAKQRSIPDDTNWTFRGPRISDSAKIASKWHVCSSYFTFPFYFTPENLSLGNLYVESSLCYVLSITVRSSSETISQKCLKRFFSPNLYWLFIGKYLGWYFLLISSKVNTKNSFRVLVDVH